ncbi:MAG: hypothetical protein ACK48N_00155, partial [Planctomyces sp.]
AGSICESARTRFSVCGFIDGSCVGPDATRASAVGGGRWRAVAVGVSALAQAAVALPAPG